jgi:DNA-binding MarR family transcriptional regulator
MAAVLAVKERFASLVSEVAREINRRRSSDACCGDLTLEQFETLRAVRQAGDRVAIGALSVTVGVDVSTMSRNASVLERNGYVRRARHDDDGRVVLVTLTPKGREALETLRCGERDVLGDIYARIAPAERAQVVKALETLCGCLAEVAVPDACCAPVPVAIRRRNT